MERNLILLDSASGLLGGRDTVLPSGGQWTFPEVPEAQAMCWHLFVLELKDFISKQNFQSSVCTLSRKVRPSGRKSAFQISKKDTNRVSRDTPGQIPDTKDRVNCLELSTVGNHAPKTTTVKVGISGQSEPTNRNTPARF